MLSRITFETTLIPRQDMYSTLCYVQADLSNVPKLKKYSPHLDSLFYQIRFDIILSFGLTEFKACIAWEEEVRWTICLSMLLSTRIASFCCRVKRKGKAHIQLHHFAYCSFFLVKGSSSDGLRPGFGHYGRRTINLSLERL